MPRYQPAGAQNSPRFEGISTFMRVSHTQILGAHDVAIVGVPFDTGGSYRVGARFGPQAVRMGSRLLRPYHPEQGVDVVQSLGLVDYGDLPIIPGSTQRSFELIEEGLGVIHESGALPIAIGGDHSIVLPELRAAARTHGKLGLIHLDAHSDTWDSYWGERFTHGTPFRRAVEEGLIDIDRAVQVGIRGSLYAPADLDEAQQMGFKIISAAQIAAQGLSWTAQRLREVAQGGPVFISFDIDFLDPAYAPGTGTPEIGGVSTREAQTLIRQLGPLDVVGMDLVEVIPQYDWAEITAIAGASVIFEVLALIASSRQDRLAHLGQPGIVAGGQA